MDILRFNEGIKLPKVINECLPVYHLFVIQVENRDQIAINLNESGISIGMHYPIPLHLQRSYSEMKIPLGTYPVVEVCSKKILSLPMFPEITEEQIMYVCEKLQSILLKINNEKR